MLSWMISVFGRKHLDIQSKDVLSRPKGDGGEEAAVDIRDLMSFRLARLAAASDKSAQQWSLCEFGLRLNEWRVLGLAAAMDPAPFAEIARMLSMDKGQLSRIVKAMAARGLMRSEPDRRDQRALSLSATHAGRDLYGRMVARAKQRNEATMACLSQQEQAELLRLLGKVADEIDESLVFSGRPA